MKALWAALLLIFGCAGAAQAACSVPYTFVNNTQIADANQVNANFAAVVNCNNAIASPFATSRLALAALPVSVGNVIVVSPNIPPATYQGVLSACTINDGGSQITASSGGCWKLTAQISYDVRWWGLTANPVHFYVAPGGNDQGTPGSGANFCVVQALPCATRTQAVAMAFKFNMLSGLGGCGQYSGVADIHLVAGLNVAESISISGPLQGAGSCSPNPVNGYGTSMVLFDGAGSSLSSWNGGPFYCYTLQSSNNGIWGIRGVDISATGNGCQYALATQIQGNGNVFNDTIIDQANNEQVHAEGNSSIQFWCGGFSSTPPGCSVKGGGARFVGVSTLSTVEFNSGTRIAIVGSPFYSSGEFIGSFYEGQAKFDGAATPFLVGSIAGTTRAFLAYGNSTIIDQTGTPSGSLVPGAGVGELFDGARIVPHVVGAVEAGFTGLGTGGTINTAPAGQYGAKFSLVTGVTPGTGQSNTGSFVYNPDVLVGDLQSGTTIPCVANIDQSNSPGGAWPSGALAATSLVNTGTGEIVIDWSYSNSPGSPITANATFQINLVCNGG